MVPSVGGKTSCGACSSLGYSQKLSVSLSVLLARFGLFFWCVCVCVCLCLCVCLETARGGMYLIRHIVCAYADDESNTLCYYCCVDVVSLCDTKTHSGTVPSLTVRTHRQSRVESSPIQSSQTLESRGVHTDRVESSQVCASPSGFLILIEQ